MNKGQSLIEVLVAIGAAVVVISAITITVVSSLNNVEYSKNQNLATSFAKQGIEIVREISQSDWASFINYGGVNYCLDKDSKTLKAKSFYPNNTCGNNVGIFSREVEINQNAANCGGDVNVIVTVLWADAKCPAGTNTYCHSVGLESCLSNLNSTQSP